MAKRFNITGTCVPDRHFMADTSAKVRQTLALVEDNQYFVINRPRQYGKTTMLLLLLNALNKSGEYLSFSISFEGVGDVVFENEATFSKMFLGLLARDAAHSERSVADWLNEAKDTTENLDMLSEFITNLAILVSKKMVLLIDEVDKSSNNQLFVSFLGMLRNKYLNAQQNRDHTFHSVVLAGVHDIKTLKLKLRPESEQKYNSPWNIAADFKVDMSLYPNEIKPMLNEYAADRGVQMDTQAVAERLFYYSSGYPFLVSKLCKMFDEEILPEKTEKEWTTDDLDTAVSRLVMESNANFDNLIKNLENDPDLYQLTYRLVVQAEQLPYNIHDPVVSLGVLYGIFSNGRGLNIHNRIYREIIANYMASKILTSGEQPSTINQFPGIYIKTDNSLDVEKLLARFQAFKKEEYSKQDRDFLERQGRLLFLAFLKPILNGHGYSFKEPQISEERRLDVVITFYQRRYVAELKVWRGEAAHQRGLAQLAGYLDGLGLREGFLVIFDHSTVKSWRQERIEVEGKSVFAVWV